MIQPVVQQVIDAINTRDRERFFGAFTKPTNVVVTDDGRAQDFQTWAEREVFGAQNKLEVDTSDEAGLRVEGIYTSAQWGAFRTFWQFTLDENGTVTRLDVGAL